MVHILVVAISHCNTQGTILNVCMLCRRAYLKVSAGMWHVVFLRKFDLVLWPFSTFEWLDLVLNQWVFNPNLLSWIHLAVSFLIIQSLFSPFAFELLILTSSFQFPANALVITILLRYLFLPSLVWHRFNVPNRLHYKPHVWSRVIYCLVLMPNRQLPLTLQAFYVKY